MRKYIDIITESANPFADEPTTRVCPGCDVEQSENEFDTTGGHDECWTCWHVQQEELDETEISVEDVLSESISSMFGDLEEGAPIPPKKPVKPSEAPSAPPPPTSGAQRNAQAAATAPQATPKNAATQAQQSQQGTQGTQQANAPEGSDDAALDATIEAGKQAEKILKNKGVL